jgi:hypothetical protein
MHHFTQNQERTINLSILLVSGPGEFPGVESNCSRYIIFLIFFNINNISPTYFFMIFYIARHKKNMSFKALPIKFLKDITLNGSSLKSCFHKRFDYILRFPYDDEEPHHRLVCELHHMNKKKCPVHFFFFFIQGLGCGLPIS